MASDFVSGSLSFEASNRVKFESDIAGVAMDDEGPLFDLNEKSDLQKLAPFKKSQAAPEEKRNSFPSEALFKLRDRINGIAQ